MYFLFDGERESLLYVGLSRYIHQRIFAHVKRGVRVGFYGAIYVPDEYMAAVEYAYIDALEPPVNLKYQQPYPAFHDHKAFAAEIRALWAPNLRNRIIPAELE